MSVEENEQVIDRRDEAYNARDWDRFLELHAESAVLHSPIIPEPLKGRTSILELIERNVTAFPDARVRMDRSFGQGNWVCREYTLTGTHTAPFERPGGETIPATSKPLRLQVCSVYKVEGGEITETSGYFDVLAMMAQLGLAPEGD